MSPRRCRTAAKMSRSTIAANDGVSPPELAEVLGSNALHGFKLTLANDTRDSAFFPTSGHYAELGVEQVIGSF